VYTKRKKEKGKDREEQSLKSFLHLSKKNSSETRKDKEDIYTHTGKGDGRKEIEKKRFQSKVLSLSYALLRSLSLSYALLRSLSLTLSLSL
jgi:hypothetical protein